MSNPHNNPNNTGANLGYGPHGDQVPPSYSPSMLPGYPGFRAHNAYAMGAPVGPVPPNNTRTFPPPPPPQGAATSPPGGIPFAGRNATHYPEFSDSSPLQVPHRSQQGGAAGQHPQQGWPAHQHGSHPSQYGGLPPYGSGHAPSPSPPSSPSSRDFPAIGRVMSRASNDSDGGFLLGHMSSDSNPVIPKGHRSGESAGSMSSSNAPGPNAPNATGGRSQPYTSTAHSGAVGAHQTHNRAQAQQERRTHPRASAARVSEQSARDDGFDRSWTLPSGNVTAGASQHVPPLTQGRRATGFYALGVETQPSAIQPSAIVSEAGGDVASSSHKRVGSSYSADNSSAASDDADSRPRKGANESQGQGVVDKGKAKDKGKNKNKSKYKTTGKGKGKAPESDADDD